MQMNCSLLCLNLAGNKLGDDGIAFICEALKVKVASVALCVLAVIGVVVGEPNADQPRPQFQRRLLCRRRRDLQCTHSGMHFNRVNELCIAELHFITLAYRLQLPWRRGRSSDWRRPEGAVARCHAERKQVNRTLVSLNLVSCNLLSQGATVIGDALKVSRPLLQLASAAVLGEPNSR